MKHNKSEASRSGHENKASSNETNEPNTSAAKVTTPTNEEYSDSIDHCQEELQQVGLLDSELVDSKGNSLTISTRLSSFVPNFLARSRHQKTSDSYCVSTETRNASTAIRAVRKMKRNGESNNSAPSGDNIDLEANEKVANKHPCRYICCVLLLMAFCLVAVLVLLFVFSPNVLDKEDKCINGHKAFQYYNLLSTKTPYSTAINYLDSSIPRLAISNHDVDTYVSSSVSKPGIFSSGQNLKEISNRLKAQEGCSVRQIHFYGRHAARTPDKEDIKELNTKIRELISRIKLGRATVSALHQPAGQARPDTPSPTDVPKVELVNQTVCYDPIEEAVSWNNYMNPDEGNLVTEFGYQESEAIAKRLKDVHPEFFDGTLASIDFTVTNETRTAQTALSFLNQMANPPNVGCALNSFPKPANLDPIQARLISGNECFKNFMTSHGKENLQFHKKCKQLSRKLKFDVDVGLKASPYHQIVADNTAEKLAGHNSDLKLTPDDAKAIYDICRYDTVLTGEPSVWCRFFKEKDLAFLEYVSDVKDFLTEVYGHKEFVESTCFVTKDMVNLFQDYVYQKTRGRKAYFHFTHSSVIQKLIAATIDLSKEDAFSLETIPEVIKTGDVPQKRSWRTSILTPFSANIAFTLYDCDKTANASTSGEGAATEIDLKSIKIVASLNEQPIRMDGCGDYVCDYYSFKKSRLFRKANTDECEYEKLCTTTLNVN